ncbi:Hexosyltransferase [Rhynchospora pubera]|uniref:Hexosyltransferase n=1 Tax=Rhynchospora pubera TaxID=906938 RepID=A0AAV8FI41_9POAL|nr:Hexosyltransferase [Rhynchospora pubera]
MFEKVISQNLILVVILPLALVCAIFLYAVPNSNFQLNLFASCQQPALSSHSNSEPEFKILIGILTLPEKYERRQIIRNAYSLQQPAIQNGQIDVRFVFCNLTTGEQKTFIAMEIMTYRDIIILNCTENMNKGKTYTYFASLPHMFPGKQRPYDYAIKSDDDTYFRFNNLVASLRDKPREDVYWGKGFEPMTTDPKNPPFMVGMGYAISWDLVEWISTSEFARNNSEGVEDIFVGLWLNIGEKGKNRYDMREKMYDFHGEEPKDFPPETIAVHMLKLDFTWAVTLRMFNVTNRLESSRLYHL